MTNLRNYLACFAFIIISLLALCSCIREDSHGFPKKVTFSAKGESKVIHGDGSNCVFFINIYDGKSYTKFLVSHSLLGKEPGSSNTDSVVCKWITVKAINSGYDIEFTAAPNESHKKRFLTFLLSFGTEESYLTVTQNGR